MAIRKRKKRFYEVEIPIIKKEILLQAYETKQLVDKFIKYDLTRLLKGKATVLSLVVREEGEKLVAIPRELRILPSFLRRAVRKGTNQVDDSFEVECRDAILKIKPFLVARRKISRAVRRALREKAKEELIKILKDKKSEEIFSDLMGNRIQKPLSITLKKIYPLSLCEVKSLKVINYKEPEKTSTKKEEITKSTSKDKKEKKVKEEDKEKGNKKEDSSQDINKGKTSQAKKE